MSRTRTEGAVDLLDDDERLAVLADEGALFAVTAHSRDLAAPIPSCPGWTLGDLVAHLGLVYRWVTRVVREERCVPPDHAERVSLQDPDPTDGPP
ncbi:MAG: maleylpyruvate isomerase N-terminal domain-containing protein [Pseudonocardiales bacterium]